MFTNLECSNEDACKSTLMVFSMAAAAAAGVLYGLYKKKVQEKHHEDLLREEVRKAMFPHKPKDSNNLEFPMPIEEAIQNWKKITETYYSSSTNIVEIYSAVGLTPLIVEALQNTPPQDALGVVNGVVQKILSIPENKDLSLTTCNSYLRSVKKRLNEAYYKKGLEAPRFDKEALKKITYLNLHGQLLYETENTTHIKKLRGTIESWAKSQEDYQGYFATAKMLNTMAQEMDALHKVFAKRIFTKTFMGVTEIFASEEKQVHCDAANGADLDLRSGESREKQKIK